MGNGSSSKRPTRLQIPPVRKRQPIFIADNFSSLDEGISEKCLPPWTPNQIHVALRKVLAFSVHKNNTLVCGYRLCLVVRALKDEVITALRDAGLESSNLILGIDFTKSNEWTGKHAFNGKSLHAIGNIPNPYEQAISIIGRTLSSFDEDNLIPCFGFGDASTRNEYVFSFYPDHRPCNGFEEALSRYREIVPHLILSGPTSFAPLILASIDIVERNHGQYHVLVIIADGQVTRNPDLLHGRLSQHEQATVDAIVEASNYPLSIVMVGVGDGPWDMMQQFDDCIPQRSFDNFQFVNFTKIMFENMEMPKKEAAFALAALMEIPLQYRATQCLSSMERNGKRVGRRKPLPPPCGVIEHDRTAMPYGRVNSVQLTEYNGLSEQVCPVCRTNQKELSFRCGHMVSFL